MRDVVASICLVLMRGQQYHSAMLYRIQIRVVYRKRSEISGRSEGKLAVNLGHQQSLISYHSQ